MSKRCPLCFGSGLRLFFGYFMPRAFGSCVQCGGTGTVELEEILPPTQVEWDFAINDWGDGA
jgi:hypothetical protein